jgi:transcriptional regulator with XRE-family HTH domain
MKSRTPLIKRVGKAIRARREALGLTQEDFADQVEMHRAYYWRVEHGQKDVRLSTLERVCESLNVSVSQLLREAEAL